MERLRLGLFCFFLFFLRDIKSPTALLCLLYVTSLLRHSLINITSVVTPSQWSLLQELSSRFSHVLLSEGYVSEVTASPVCESM